MLQKKDVCTSATVERPNRCSCFREEETSTPTLLRSDSSMSALLAEVRLFVVMFPGLTVLHAASSLSDPCSALVQFSLISEVDARVATIERIQLKVDHYQTSTFELLSLIRNSRFEVLFPKLFSSSQVGTGKVDLMQCSILLYPRTRGQ